MDDKEKSVFIKIYEKPWEYTLYEYGDKLLLSIVCGTVGIYEVNIVLNIEERAEYLQKGTEFLTHLAIKIAGNQVLQKERALLNIKID